MVVLHKTYHLLLQRHKIKQKKGNKMYKNIEVLDKKKHNGIKFDEISFDVVAKNIGVVPVGVDEILDMSCFAPVFISAGDNKEFVAFTGISKEVNIYNNNTAYIANFVKTYPFFNIIIKDTDENLNTVIAIDTNAEYVGKNKKNTILNKKFELEELANQKIEQVRALNNKREISRIIVKELEKKDLLVKKDFRVNVNGEEKIILEEFYVINRDELLKLDDATLALWAKKGWMSVIDAHTKSLNNFQKIFQTK